MNHDEFSSPQHQDDDVIWVREVAEFVYCERSWWYKFVRGVPENSTVQKVMAQGSQLHEIRSQQVASIGKQLTVAKVLFLLGAILILLALVLAGLRWL